MSAIIASLDRTVGACVVAISRVGAALALITMTVLVVVGVLARSLLNISLPVTIEYAEYLVPVVGLWGAAYALRHGAHVRADLVLDFLAPPVRRWVILAGDIAGLGYLAVLTVYTGETAWTSISRGYTSIYPSATPYGYWQLLVPLSLLLLAVQLLLEILRQLAGHPEVLSDESESR